MFDFLPEVCRELHGHLVSAYWVLLIPFTVLLIILEFFKMPDGQINAGDILKRVVLSIILLLSIDEVVNLIALVGDGITDKINGVKSLWDLMAEVSQSYEDNSVSWLKFREAVIFILSLCSYIIAYLGVFVANVLIHFVWSVLYVCSPLMILMYVSRSTSFVTTNLYKGLINVVVWKVLWSILAVMLLKLATAPQSGGWDNFLTAILINLCIGISMLFIPFAAKSLLTDGMASAASALAAVPTAATGALVKGLAVKHGANLTKGTIDRGKSALTSLKKPISQGLHAAKERFNRGMKSKQEKPQTDESNILRPNFNRGRNNDDKK
jgi:hypothetical protein